MQCASTPTWELTRWSAGFHAPARSHASSSGYVLMIGTCVLLLSGSIEQTQINWNVSAPSSGASVAIFYASGIVFAVSAILIMLNDLFRLATGKVATKDLVIVRESEEEL